ncbi:bifunctional DNA-formamidopyrimidine glycosylase/DNA-(apurinic or apyrimidinic site) lyase [Paenibacillus sp. GCM10012307]|uniref:Formamidopyrimidine-DNA glycosylase n=1 Tax=Paenibacillus roseus TaxID=2798579 RepID=A0A934MWZ3_9BACL|nr:bifunctional DNA-formamidopyrimidine glycosylase/DNA-(apurinic or apyrimidinic site) lyase [Paenibacillus roseus]MBJ6363657.1 bifunctional DNA-formamidopyrimidine glycosylase/DNA-(apurinic or apyrimidinic site) lyase [Paenibacillus roseus]
MPEWPEMETYRKLLTGTVAGQTIQTVEVTRDKTVNIPAEQFKQELEGRMIWFVERRGKYILFHLDNGKRLLLHLMLGGLMYYGSEDDKPDRTTQVVFQLDKGYLYFIGLRLGFLHYLSVKEVEEKIGSLGPDPFDKRLTPEAFKAKFRGKRSTLKSALVDQQFISGIGNCYADEIAFTAGIRPDAKIASLTEETLDGLYAAMHKVLQDAAAKGGYIELPFTKDDQLTGGYNEHCLVYDRGGEPCVQCGTEIVKAELASRKVFYCPNCQKES